MKILFIFVGRIKRPYFKDAVEEYLKRIGRYASVDIVEVKDGSAGGRGGKATPTAVMEKEAEKLLKPLGGGDYVIALSEEGTTFASHPFANVFEGALSGEKSRIVFIIGGAFGLSGDVKKRADLVWSLSPMTLPHELARLVCAEQVYRAFTIMKGEPYSH